MIVVVKGSAPGATFVSRLIGDIDSTVSSLAASTSDITKAYLGGPSSRTLHLLPIHSGGNETLGPAVPFLAPHFTEHGEATAVDAVFFLVAQSGEKVGLRVVPYEPAFESLELLPPAPEAMHFWCALRTPRVAWTDMVPHFWEKPMFYRAEEFCGLSASV